MPTVIDPKETTRAAAFELWMKAPNPMVTFMKTLDVTNLIRVSRKRNLKFNMLMDYCIGKAASGVKEFYMLPVGSDLVRYDAIAVNTIVKNRTGEVSSCDILYTPDLNAFNEEYLRHTAQVADYHISDLINHIKYAEKIDIIKNIGFGFDIDGTGGLYPDEVDLTVSIHDMFIEKYLRTECDAECVKDISGENLMRFLCVYGL